MNAQNAHKYLPLVQALANGLTIQCNDRGEWVDVESLYTDVYGPDEYRIKPEPRTFKLYIIDTANGETVMTTHPTFDSRWKQITVQEVLQ
jgi:hypothetical protein